MAQFALIEAGDAHHTHLEWLTWRRWFDEHGLSKLQPKRWLYFNYAYQMVQAALTGQGMVLARLPLVAEALANGDLIEPLPKLRMDSPMAYWLIIGPRSSQRPEIKAFCEWLMQQSRITRQTIGDNVFANLGRQAHGDRELVLVLHGLDADHAGLKARAAEAGVDNLVVVEADASLTLGACMNLGVDAASGRYVAKMDDDNFYGAHFLGDLLDAGIFIRHAFPGLRGLFEPVIALHDAGCIHQHGWRKR